MLKQLITGAVLALTVAAPASAKSLTSTANEVVQDSIEYVDTVEGYAGLGSDDWCFALDTAEETLWDFYQNPQMKALLRNPRIRKSDRRDALSATRIFGNAWKVFYKMEQEYCY